MKRNLENAQKEMRLRMWRTRALEVEKEHLVTEKVNHVQGLDKPFKNPKIYESVEGYVYFLHCKGYVKIGKAIDITKRLSVIQTSNPFKVSVMFLVMTHDIHNYEKKFHELFKSCRYSGEWFKLGGALLNFLVNKGVKFKKGSKITIVSSSIECRGRSFEQCFQ